MNIDYNTTAPIFNIQSFCIHDGPGIRTTVFLKGCPLHCAWCQNPESLTPSPQLMFYAHKCSSCKCCILACSHNAIAPYGNKVITDRSRCTNCGECTSVCRNHAREIVGSTMSVTEVYSKVVSEKIFLTESGGGMTISGGEALFHPDFTASICSLAQSDNIHTAIETSCFASTSVVDHVFAHLNLALIDLKHMNPTLHKQYTGVDNRIIHTNIKHIATDLKVPIIIRFPIIPGYNDQEENLVATGRFVRNVLGKDAEIDLLPYHNLGDAKRTALDVASSVKVIRPSADRMNEIAKVLQSFDLTIKIGG